MIRTLTNAELYAARKLGSKLTRALCDIAEARLAAGALDQEVLRQLGVGTFFPFIMDIEPKIEAMRNMVRANVPAAGPQQRWESERIGDPGVILGKLEPR